MAYEAQAMMIMIVFDSIQNHLLWVPQYCNCVYHTNASQIPCASSPLFAFEIVCLMKWLRCTIHQLIFQIILYITWHSKELWDFQFFRHSTWSSLNVYDCLFGIMRHASNGDNMRKCHPFSWNQNWIFFPPQPRLILASGTTVVGHYQLYCTMLLASGDFSPFALEQCNLFPRYWALKYNFQIAQEQAWLLLFVLPQFVQTCTEHLLSINVISMSHFCFQFMSSLGFLCTLADFCIKD